MVFGGVSGRPDVPDPAELMAVAGASGASNASGGGSMMPAAGVFTANGVHTLGERVAFKQ